MAKQVGVVGASGYAGAELLRLIDGHPVFDLAFAAAGANAGQPISSLFPNLIGLGNHTFVETDPASFVALDLLFLALPHGSSGELTADLPTGLRVVDLGADHRLVNPAAWDKYYGGHVAAPAWTYGLPELVGRAKEVADSIHVANPGCYATAIQLASAPLLAAGVANADDIVVVAASGTSGAGRKDSIALSATEVVGSMSAYKVGGLHQHTAEVTQELTAIAGSEVTLSFTPMLAPMPRGIIATVTLPLVSGATPSDVRSVLVDAYAGSPFVYVLPDGQWPTTGATFGTNAAHLQLAVDEVSNRIVVVSTIDNLGKGAAGQAIQNANLMFGLDESAGLTALAVAP